MVILRAIGSFFCKIGRWIRDTAWVQPLLIVGGIFAVIFSIPYIVNAVEDANTPGDPAKQYYNSHKISLNGAKTAESEADKLLNYLTASERTPEDEKKWGKKFFVSFVESNCEGCKTVYPGFKTLEENWNKGEFEIKNQGKEVEDFKLYTIFVDEEVEDKDLKGDETTFTKYFHNNHITFFESAPSQVDGNVYYDNEGGDNSPYFNNLQSIISVDDFVSPTTFLIDFSSGSEFGISEIVFNFAPKDQNESSYGYARTLFDCYTHNGVFAKENENN